MNIFNQIIFSKGSKESVFRIELQMFANFSDDEDVEWFIADLKDLHHHYTSRVKKLAEIAEECKCSIQIEPSYEVWSQDVKDVCISSKGLVKDDGKIDSFKYECVKNGFIVEEQLI